RGPRVLSGPGGEALPCSGIAGCGRAIAVLTTTDTFPVTRNTPLANAAAKRATGCLRQPRQGRVDPCRRGSFAGRVWLPGRQNGRTIAVEGCSVRVRQCRPAPVPGKAADATLPEPPRAAAIPARLPQDRRKRTASR